MHMLEAYAALFDLPCRIDIFPHPSIIYNVRRSEGGHDLIDIVQRSQYYPELSASYV